MACALALIVILLTAMAVAPSVLEAALAPQAPCHRAQRGQVGQWQRPARPMLPRTRQASPAHPPDLSLPMPKRRRHTDRHGVLK
jgi:hypothetical protein